MAKKNKKWEIVVIDSKRHKIKYKNAIEFNEINKVLQNYESLKELKERIGKVGFAEKEITQLNLGFHLGQFYSEAREIQYSLGKLLQKTGAFYKTTSGLFEEFFEYENIDRPNPNHFNQSHPQTQEK